MASYVYFLRERDRFGPVKIGCSGVPHARLEAYHAVAPYPLELAATVPGDRRLEMRFHQHFRRFHSHHEWFHPAAPIYLAIEQVAAGTFDLSTLPDGSALPRRISPWPPERRRAQSLKLRIGRLRWHYGVFPPPEIDRAIEALGSDDASAQAQAAARCEGFLRDPLAHGGTIAPYEWAQERWAKYGPSLLSRKAA